MLELPYTRWNTTLRTIHDSLAAEYIASVYAEMRKEEAEAHVPHSYTTARTLLSILRLAQALARLRFADRVSQVCRKQSISPLPCLPECPTLQTRLRFSIVFYLHCRLLLTVVQVAMHDLVVSSSLLT